MPRDTVTVPREVLEDALEYFTGSRVPTPPSMFGALIAGASPMGSLIRKLNSALLPIPSSDPEGGARGIQGSIATRQATDETAASVLSDPVSDIATAISNRVHREFCSLASEDRCQLHGIIQEELLPYEFCLQNIIAANQEFRDQLPANWESDKLNDACLEASRLFGRRADTKSDGGVEGHAIPRTTSATTTRYPETGGEEHMVATARRAEADEASTKTGPAGIKPGPSDQLTKAPSADHDDGNLTGGVER